MSDTRFGTWNAAESPVTIEYSLVVIEEIRQEVTEGFQRLSRGGVEVGGILYGTRDGRTIRILAMRPIACEHARGPAFLLSESDKKLMEEQIQRASEDPRLTDMSCLGWFSSHTRSEIVLTESDVETYTKYFGAAWQVTLVIRPGRGGSMRAGFFVREHDGSVRGDSSYMEFNFPDRLAGVLDRPRTERLVGPRGQRVAPGEAAAAAARKEEAQEQAQPAALPPGPQLLPSPPPRSKWPWLVAWALFMLAAVIFGLRYFVLRPHPDPMALSVIERDGQLQIGWNHNAGPVSSAVRGSLIIADGQAPRSFPLTRQNLEHGSFTYKRTSDDVEIRMSVENASGDKAEEATTFVAAGPSGDIAEKLKSIEQERDDLKNEVDRLTKENASQAIRIQQLDRSLKVLQARPGIQ